MKRSRFTEEQIIAMIKEQEAGMPTAEVCRKHSVSSASFYKYKASQSANIRDDLHRSSMNFVQNRIAIGMINELQ